MSDGPLFERVALIGIGLIGSSVARRVKRDGLARSIVCCAKTERSRKTALALVEAVHRIPSRFERFKTEWPEG